MAQRPITMNLASAYLAKPSTKRILNRKPGEEGFSLIELVVVIAVLAVLVAVALPNFLGVQDDGAVRAAQNALTNAVKECAINATRNTVGNFGSVSLNGFVVAPGTPTLAGSGTACTNALATPGVGAYNVTGSSKFPSFHITWNGAKTCARGTATVTTGCSATGTWE